MSGEIEKWRGNVPASLETRLAEWRQSRGTEIRREPPPVSDNHRILRVRPTSVQPVVRGEPVWLPRLCAVHGKGWFASYIRNISGDYTFGETIRMTEHLWQQHKNNAEARIVHVFDLSREECPWCGATHRHWNGPVLCSGCGAKVCFGRTTADDYFHCFCGSHGQLRHINFQEFGFTPSLRPPDNAGR
jgi:hypothetical protein